MNQAHLRAEDSPARIGVSFVVVKRRLAKLVLFLLLGAVVNVAVAWGVANLLGERTFVTRTISGPGIATVTSEHNWPLEKMQGWPMRSFSEQVPLDEYSAVVTVIELKNAKLAYGPIWPGFAINTIFYAAILWLLTLGPFTARRMIRRKRGCCINCGYDLRGTSGGRGAAACVRSVGRKARNARR